VVRKVGKLDGPGGPGAVQCAGSNMTVAARFQIRSNPGLFRQGRNVRWGSETGIAIARAWTKGKVEGRETHAVPGAPRLRETEKFKKNSVTPIICRPGFSKRGGEKWSSFRCDTGSRKGTRSRWLGRTGGFFTVVGARPKPGLNPLGPKGASADETVGAMARAFRGTGLRWAVTPTAAIDTSWRTSLARQERMRQWDSKV